MEVSSSTTTSPLLNASDQNAELINTTESSVTADEDHAESVKITSDAPDCDIDTVAVPYGPIVCPDFYSTDPVGYSKDVRDSKAVHGSSGLYNLGNTCYMNSGLQSLISCAPLVKYFAETYSFNESNHHMLTYHFYILLCKMWSGQFSVVHPRTFKDFLGLYHSQFEDYRQHDCQEFLAFLLDTLHEQLNVSTLTNNLSGAAPILDQNESKSVDTFDSSAPSTSVLPPSEIGMIAETPSASSMSITCDERLKNDCDEERNFHDDISKDKEEEGRDSAVVSVTSSSPQSTDERLDSSVNTTPEYCHEISVGHDVSSGEEGFMSANLRCSHSHTGRDSDVRDKSDCDYISSSCPALRRYTSRSTLDDVTSSDMGLSVKPSLKRVSSDSGVTASGLVFFSEDSNHSSVSVHSTDSEQSSAFKRLKIDSLEMNKNSNSNNNSPKDFVSSSSDCRAENHLKIRSEKLYITKCNESAASSNMCVSSSSSPMHKTVNIINNDVPICSEALPSVHEIPVGDKDLPDLEDFYCKETKTLNTNVLVTEHAQEITCDSEKFAKVDNRNRPPSKEINLLQEAFGEEDKVDKLLISQHFGLKDTNLLTQASSSVKMSNSNTKALNNSRGEDDEMICSSLAKCGSSDEVLEEKTLSPLKNMADTGTMRKLDEVEKNVQMQAYSKFNTTPARSNIRTDLTNTNSTGKSIDVDEADEEESSDEEDVQKSSHCSSVDNCSSIPNCLRHFSPSEVAMANKAWFDYKARNDSIIVSTFQGQFRSTVVCSECSHVSVTYEPFMYLSLPIPHAMEQQLCVTHISVNKSPVRYLLDLLKTDKIGTAKKKLKELTGDNEGDIIMAEMLDQHVSRILDDNVLLKYVNTVNRKIYAFEVINALDIISNATPEPFVDQLLNNHEEHSINIRESHYLGSPSGEDAGDAHVHRIDSQLSNHSFDSITANSPTSRDTMDLGFSDTEMCESNAAQEIGLSSSYFHEERKEEDDICQSTSDEPDCCSKINSRNKSTVCLSWQIVDERESDDIDGRTSIDVTIADSSPLSFGNDYTTTTTTAGVACSSKFWVEQPDNVHYQSTRSPVSDTAAPSQSTEISPSSPIIQGNYDGVGEISNRTKYIDEGSTSRHDSMMETEESGKHSSSRSCPSPETFVCQSDQIDVLAQAASRLSEDPGSYFLQTSHFDSLGPVCPTDNTIDVVNTSCTEEDPPIMSGDSHCVTAGWSSFVPLHETVNTGDTDSSPSTSADVVSTSGHINRGLNGEGTESSIPVTTDQWRSCAICLEDLPSSQLLTHVSCDGIFCQNCLDMSVKHTADVSAYCCPICLQPASICEDFIHLPSSSNDAKSKIRMLPVCITYRHCVIDNTDSSSLQLLGHPNIIQLPSVISGVALYTVIDRLLSRPVFTYSIMLTDGQGLSCSRCPYAIHCTGCEIPREGDISLDPSDCLTIHSCETLSPDEVNEMRHVYDDVSLGGLRSSEPTTLMDCFRAFTQSEILDEHNPWYCPQCDRNQCAKKTMTVWRYPDNLIIHLKRFVYQDLSSSKVDTKVTFPHHALDVKGFLSGPSSSSLLYNLYSIVCHVGSASSGHYTSFTKHPLTTQWYYYNDETVSQQTPSEIEFTSGYVLFYQRQGTEVDFTPPQYNPSMWESSDDGRGGISTSSAAPFQSQAEMPSAPSSSMALVLYEPPVTSSSSSCSSALPVKKPNNDNVEADDDYDFEDGCSQFMITFH